MQHSIAFLTGKQFEYEIIGTSASRDTLIITMTDNAFVEDKVLWFEAREADFQNRQGIIAFTWFNCSAASLI